MSLYSYHLDLHAHSLMGVFKNNSRILMTFFSIIVKNPGPPCGKEPCCAGDRKGPGCTQPDLWRPLQPNVWRPLQGSIRVPGKDENVIGGLNRALSRFMKQLPHYAYFVSSRGSSQLFIIEKASFTRKGNRSLDFQIASFRVVDKLRQYYICENIFTEAKYLLRPKLSSLL